VNEPQRGEVWIVDLGLVAKIRPSLIISIPAAETDRALITIIPHTTSDRGSRFEVASSVRFLKPGAFDVQNLITIPHAKLVRKLGHLPSAQLAEIENTVKSWSGLR
jgi:mRNA interferase MazF